MPRGAKWFLAARVAAIWAMLLGAMTGLSADVEASTPGVVGVTHGKVDVGAPPSAPAGQQWRYGLGLPIQLDATTGGLLVNIRQNGTQYCDFEVGTDLIPFTSLDKIDARRAVPVSRPTKELNPWTGTPSITSKYPMMGGFVPRGARLADGSPHPHAGTGFGILEVGFYPADFSQPLPSRIGYHVEFQQLRYDVREFKASAPTRMPHLSIGDSGWKITNMGLSPAIPDGKDLLFPATCSDATHEGVVGVARFQHGESGWQPTSFTPISSRGEAWFEPSLVRDVDGSLLFTARNDASAPISVWGSADGRDWKRLLFIDNARAYSPVVLNQAADGSPYLVTTLAASVDRNILEIVPLRADRAGLEKPITLRNGPVELGPAPDISRKEANQFGPAPDGFGWYIDHGTGNVIRLADGRWHAIVTYRVDAKAEHFGHPHTPFSGHYVEEVSSSGDPRPMGFRFESTPADKPSK